MLEEEKEHVDDGEVDSFAVERLEAVNIELEGFGDGDWRDEGRVREVGGAGSSGKAQGGGDGAGRRSGEGGFEDNVEESFSNGSLDQLRFTQSTRLDFGLDNLGVTRKPLPRPGARRLGLVRRSTTGVFVERLEFKLESRLEKIRSKASKLVVCDILRLNQWKVS